MGISVRVSVHLQVEVVGEKRLYRTLALEGKAIAEDTEINSCADRDTVDFHEGILKTRRVLNTLHQRMGVDGFSEVRDEHC